MTSLAYLRNSFRNQGNFLSEYKNLDPTNKEDLKESASAEMAYRLEKEEWDGSASTIND